MTKTDSFAGAKIALLVDDDILVLRRDDFDHIPWPNAVDLPGGAAEFGETPIECALRETQEELGISVPEAAIIWQRAFPGIVEGQGTTWFLVARIDQHFADKMVLGDEGQAAWQEPVETFLARDDAVPHFQARLLVFLEENGVYRG